MDILPIKSIRDEDAPIVGADLVNLAKLAQLGFSVAPGVVVCPPEIELNTVLKYFNLNEREVFEQSLTLVKKEILKIPIPENFIEVFSKKKIDAKVLWANLLEVWLGEVRTKVWQSGFKEGVTLGLSAQSVFFTKKVVSRGQAYFDPIKESVVVKVLEGVGGPKIDEQLIELIEKANKKLFLPQVYHWIIEEGGRSVQVVKLSPFTQSDLEFRHHPKDVAAFEESSVSRAVKSVTKVYLDLSEGLVTNPEADGVLISAEKVGDSETQIFKIIESALAFNERDVIFKLSDKVEHIGGVRGSLRLIHQGSLLKSEVESFLFARNHKKLLNLQICVPFTRSCNEFLEIKRALATMGVNRKGSLKLWLEVAVPENIINLQEYIVGGLDGVVLNLDELSGWLGGFDSNQPESAFYQKQVKALIKFLDDGLRLLHRERIPVLAMGSLALHDDVLEFLVSRGVKGIVVSLANSHYLHDHLRFVEKRLVRNKS